MIRRPPRSTRTDTLFPYTTLFRSYLVEKTGQFLPKDAAARMQAIQWLMWQMGGFGPMLGQAHHFLRAAKEQVPYGVERYTTERSEERRVGKECVSPCRSRWSPYT